MRTLEQLEKIVGLLVQAANAMTTREHFAANAEAQREWEATGEDEPT